MPKKKEVKKKDIMRVRNSRKVYVNIYLMIFILIVVVALIKYRGMPLNQLAIILVGLFALFSIFSVEIHRLGNSYEINDHSLVHTKGILSKKSRSMDFFAVSDIEVRQGPWQRALNFGDVSVRLYSGESDSPVKNINNPTKFAEFLRKKIAAKRKESGDW